MKFLSPSNAAVTPRPAPRAPGMQTHGLSSSDELHAGLDVQMLSFAALPVDLVRELLRMRKLWGGAEPARPN